ncbi:unnamed protein product [Cochlearia groenlandica]
MLHSQDHEREDTKHVDVLTKELNELRTEHVRRRTFPVVNPASEEIIGICEALELRDGGSDYLGKGVSKAVGNVNLIIGPTLIGKVSFIFSWFSELLIQLVSVS